MLSKFKKILLIMLFLSSFSFAFADNCQFDSKDTICPRYSSSFIEFNLDFTPNELLQNYTAKIYLTQNPSNKIQTKIEENIVKNINPLTEPGVYILEITSSSKSGKTNTQKFDFIFDNLEPMPPIVPVTITSKTIIGKTQFPNTSVFAKILGTTSVSTTSDNNGDFTLNLNDLDENNINIVEFTTKNSQNLESVKILRTIILKNLDSSSGSSISSISIDDNLNEINERTIKGVNKYITSNRNFLISGGATAADGTLIYIDGVETQIINQRFAEFVLLNSGENTIKIQDNTNSISKEIIVEYVNPKFIFKTFNVDKITSNRNPIVTGSTNLNLEFDVYLNGDYISSETPISNQFSFNLNSLIPGKNILYLSGPNNQILEEIIYLDTENPKIELLSQTNLTSLSNFVFKITDDLGIDLDTLKIKVGNKIFSNKQIDVIGDYIGVKFNDLTDGIHTYNIEITDRSGKKSIKSGQIDISEDNILVEQIEIDDGYFLGNSIFLKHEKSKIILKPSKFIAFKHIYLDNEDQVEYEIKSNKFIELYLEPKNKNGTLELIYIDKDHNEYTQILNYFTDLEKPKVKLDYISNALTSNNKIVRISGEIIDENFDFETLKINSQNSYQRIGNYFESYIKFTGSNEINLQITGNDYSENNIEDGIFGSLIYSDSKISTISFTNPSKFGLTGKVDNYDRDNNIIYLTSYSTINSNNMYLANNFILPISQKNGLQSINLQAKEKSGNKVNSNEIFIVDSLKPEVKLIESNGAYKLLIDGTLSSIKSVNITRNNLIPLTESICSQRISKYSACYNIPILLSDDILNIRIEDEAGNVYDKSITLSDLEIISTSNDVAQIFFNGNDLETYKDNSFIQGNIISGSLINSVKINGNNCQFDDISFVCLVNLNNGENSFSITVSNINGDKTESISIEKLQYNNNIDLTDLTSSALYKIGTDYYISSNDLLATIFLLNSSQVNILIDNKKYLIGNKQTNSNINIDLSNQIAQKNKDEFEITIISEDENSNSAFTSFKVFYSRIIETFVNILIE